jgi:hypothetical protein
MRHAFSLLTAAAHPGLGARLSPLRRVELDLAGHTGPRPTLVAVLGVEPRVGASILAALLTQALAALAPGRVAALAATGPALAARLGARAPARADVRELLKSAATGLNRRAIDPYLAPGPHASVLTLPDPRRVDLAAAVRIVARRHPVVVADLPVTAAALAATAGAVVVVGNPHSAEPRRAYEWLRTRRPDHAAESVVTVGPRPRRRPDGQFLDIGVPFDVALGNSGPVRLADLRTDTLTAIEAVLCQAIRPWPELPAQGGRRKLSEGRDPEQGTRS